MGAYLNPGNMKYYEAVKSEIYIDKTELLHYTNSVIHTMQKYICVSRPRRFGKSVTANMLAAYYGRGCDSEALFSSFKIAGEKDFGKYLNQYNVIFLNMQELLSRTGNMKDMLSLLKKSVLWDLLEEYAGYRFFDESDLMRTMQDIYRQSSIPFILIIDEWDCIFREYQGEKTAQEQYLDFLRDFMKDKEYISLAYMTGILPIKKYGTHSALNMFSEFSMMNPRQLSEFVGFTGSEVADICKQYHMEYGELAEWYDGYHFEGTGAVFSPKSVVEAALSGVCDYYWNQTETFEALQTYIDLNFDGLRDNILTMMSGERIPVSTGSFTNDMTTFHSGDDVLTLLIHLGYLGYDRQNKQVYIPNGEIMNEYVTAVSVSDWGEISQSLKCSADTLYAIWNKRSDRVAAGIEQAHFETSHIQYNDENALSYTISLALYAARNFYTVHRELPGGKGFADMVFLPRKKFMDKPALVVELKWDKNAAGAIRQIRDKQYFRGLEAYKDNMLLVGINYDKKTKAHYCEIEAL